MLCTFSPSLPFVAHCCSSSLFLFLGLAVMVTRCLVKVLGSHHSLSLLTIFFHFHVTLTGITSGTVQHMKLQVSFSHTAIHNQQVVHFFSNIMVWEIVIQVITHTILNSACSDCSATPPPQQIMIYLLPPPYFEKGKCISNPNNSTGVSCQYIDTRHTLTPVELPLYKLDFTFLLQFYSRF